MSITVRDLPGSSTVDYFVIPASSTWAFNTNCCFMAFLYVRAIGASGNNLCFFGAEWTRGWWCKINSTATLIFGKTPVSFPASTITVPLNTWCGVALMSTSGGNAHFKIWNGSTGVLQTQTVANASAITSPQAADAGRIGNWVSASSTEALNAQIQRAVVSQGYPTDAEFVHWCKYGVLPESVTIKGAWKMKGDSPELDLSGNGNNLTVVGTTTDDSGFKYKSGFQRTFPTASSYERLA